METDVAIAGGGPAGTALAIGLRERGRRVVILESSDYSGIRAGETIQPATRPLLERLGVWQSFAADAHVTSHGVLSAWGADELQANDFFSAPRGNGWHLDRSRFDRMLASEAERRGAALLTRTRVASVVRHDEAWRIETRGGDTIDCAIVVDATGRRTSIARHLGIRKRVFDRLAGVFGIIDVANAAADSFTAIEAVHDGWWYAARVPGDRVAVAFMSDVDVVRREGMQDRDVWTKRLRETNHMAQRADGALRGELSVHAAHSTLLEHIAGKGWLAIGDAASAYDPLSSQGIHKALASADVAVWAIANGKLDEYERTVRASFESYLVAHAAMYASEGRWPDSLFWSRRQRRLTLDPRSTIACNGDAPGDARLTLVEPRWSAAELRELCAACEPPCAAHEVVGAFRGERRDDEIVLALQALIREHVLRLV